MTHEEKEKWIKYLMDFAYEQDGEFGQCRIKPEDVCLKISKALASAEKKGREEGWTACRESLKDDVVTEIVAEELKKTWNEAISAVELTMRKMFEGTARHYEQSIFAREIASKIEALRK